MEAWTKSQAPQVSKEIRTWVHLPSLLGPEHYSLHPHCPPPPKHYLGEECGRVCRRNGGSGERSKVLAGSGGRRQVPVPSEKA